MKNKSLVQIIGISVLIFSSIYLLGNNGCDGGGKVLCQRISGVVNKAECNDLQANRGCGSNNFDVETGECLLFDCPAGQCPLAEPEKELCGEEVIPEEDCPALSAAFNCDSFNFEGGLCRVFDCDPCPIE